MARPAEKDIYLQFKTKVPELAGADDDLCHEGPDVIATTTVGHRIGIELTGYFHGTAPKGTVSQVQREQFQRKAVREAQRVFETNGGPPLHVQVAWYDRVATEPLDRLAQAISEQVAKRLPTVPPTANNIGVRIGNHEMPDWLAVWVHAITILRTAGDTAHYWDPAMSGYTDASAEGIRERIADKEQKLRSYRPCDENWLLIHSGDQTMAASMTLHPYAAEEVYATSFDRVYVFDLAGRAQRLGTS